MILAKKIDHYIRSKYKFFFIMYKRCIKNLVRLAILKLENINLTVHNI